MKLFISSKKITVFLTVVFAMLMLFALLANADTEEDVDFEPEPEVAPTRRPTRGTPTPPPTPPTPTPPPVPRTVRFIRDIIPSTCPITVRRNYLVTMSYTAHYVQVTDGQQSVGEKFDETAPYTTVTLQANNLKMMEPLMRGIMGACLDERRSVVIPWEMAKLNDPDIAKETDFVFLVNIVDITPMVDYFDNMDIDRNGCVTPDELKTYIIEQNRTAPHLVDLAVDKLMAVHDKDKDGYIECGEFQSENKYCASLICVPVYLKRQEEARLARLEAERLERERLAILEAQRIAAEEEALRIRLEEERIAAEEAEKRRIEAERRLAELKRLEEERRIRLEMERLEREAAAAERLEAANAARAEGIELSEEEEEVV